MRAGLVLETVELAGGGIGVTSRFAQNCTLSGKPEESGAFHKRGYTDGWSPPRQNWQFLLQNPLPKLGRKVTPSCTSLAVQF